MRSCETSIDENTAATTSTLDRIQPGNDCVHYFVQYQSIDGPIPGNWLTGYLAAKLGGGDFFSFLQKLLAKLISFFFK